MSCKYIYIRIYVYVYKYYVYTCTLRMRVCAPVYTYIYAFLSNTLKVCSFRGSAKIVSTEHIDSIFPID